MKKERPSLMVKKVDTKRLHDVLRQYMIAVYGSELNTDELTVDELVAVPLLGQKVRGKQAYGLVCTEGVGWLPDAYWALYDLNAVGDTGQRTQFKLYAGRIEDYITDEEVDLAEWIRTFGSRLETNFSIWYSCATNASYAGKQLS